MDVVIIVSEFKRYLKVRGYAQKTVESYAWSVDAFKDYLLSLDIHDLRKVNHKCILDYQARVNQQGLAMETKALKIRGVKRLFEYLTDANRLLINPTEGVVETHRQQRKTGPVLSIDEMRILLKQPNLSFSSQIRDRAIMEVLYSTGIRSNELMNLHVYDVDFKDKVLFVRKAKGRRQRIVPLGSGALIYLKEYLEKVRPRQAGKNPKQRKLFLTAHGRPMTWIAARVRIDQYRKQAGIKTSIGLHAFRRSCATHMVQKGADIRYVQKLLGHKYLKTTQAYTKVVRLDVKKTHEKTHPNARKDKKNED